MAKLIIAGVQEYQKWIGMQWTCTATGNVYEVEQSDLKTISEIGIGAGRDDTTALAIKCPCGGHAYKKNSTSKLEHISR